MAGKTVFITGCSEGGIGFALAKEYHEKGHKVFASARSLTSMKALEVMGISTISLDVTDYDNISDVKDQVERQTGGLLDILVNNAGLPSGGPLAEQSTEAAKRVFDVNVFGVMEVTKTFLPLLISTQGSIILVGSFASVVHIPFNGPYNMSKAALMSYGDTLRVELAPFRVKVSTIISGAVETRLAKPELFELPAKSMYSPIRTDYAERVKLFSGKGVMKASQWASWAVGATTKRGLKAHIWLGALPFTWFVWLGTFLPRTFLDHRLSQATGLTKLASLLSKSQ